MNERASELTESNSKYRHGPLKRIELACIGATAAYKKIIHWIIFLTIPDSKKYYKQTHASKPIPNTDNKLTMIPLTTIIVSKK